ncbi:MAG: hypothetical protein ABW198_12285 [Pseudorhodoplanes sp.]
MRSVVLAVTLAALSLQVAQAQTPAAETVAEKDVPKTVTARLRCSKPSGPVTMRAFAGGFVFSQPCPSGTETPDRLVYATDKIGTGARLLQFHRPEGRRVSELGSVTFTTADSEIAGTVGRLSRRICKAEGAWRLEGKTPQPGLVFWRQTRDCDGKSGWQTMVTRKR